MTWTKRASGWLYCDEPTYVLVPPHGGLLRDNSLTATNADAALLALNAHADLVAALTEFVEQAEEFHKTTGHRPDERPDDCDPICRAIPAAKAALAKAAGDYSMDISSFTEKSKATCRTVAEVIEYLQTLPPETPVMHGFSSAVRVTWFRDDLVEDETYVDFDDEDEDEDEREG